MQPSHAPTLNNENWFTWKHFVIQDLDCDAVLDPWTIDPYEDEDSYRSTLR